MRNGLTKALLALLLVAILSVSPVIVGAETDEKSRDEEASDNESGDTPLETPELEMTDGKEIMERFDDIEFVEQGQEPFGVSLEKGNSKVEYFNDYGEIMSHDLESLIGTNSMYKGAKTRASDDEETQDSQDWGNGSVISQSGGETIDGTLTWTSIQASQDTVDWYKLPLDDVLTTANSPNAIYNITVSIDSFTASEGDLYEFAIDDSNPQQPTLAEDYADIINVNLFYVDEMMGVSDIGGFEYYYDDGDDSDGWTWDDNWTHNFRSPRHSWNSEDTDGFANYLTEVGWIYIGIRMNWVYNPNTVINPNNRDRMGYDYQLTIDTSSKEQMDKVGNHWKNATSFSPLGEKQTRIRTHSLYNNIDWWKFTGSNSDMLWNMSIKINRTWGIIWSQATQTQFWDNWITILIVWENDGEDNTWGTSDDGMSAVAYQFTYAFQNSRNSLNAWLRNNWTDAPIGQRGAWIGLLNEPIHGAIQGGQVAGYYYPDHYTYSDYEIELDVREVAPNVKPEIPDVQVTSDFEQDPGGGYYETEYTVFVNYSDEDNDPPEEIIVILDKDTPYEQEVNIVDNPTNLFDEDYTDNKRYKLEMLGEDLTDEPFPHTLHVRAKDDVPVNSIRSSKLSDLFQHPIGIRVWDDEPVERNQNWMGFPEIMEDEDVNYFDLEGYNGVFDDPESDFRGFRVKNATTEEWDGDYDSELMHVNITFKDGIWKAAVTPKHNQHGTESITLMGYDDHSSAELTTSITIRPVNDPPKVMFIRVDGNDYQVDNNDPLRPVAHLEDLVTVREDEEFSFEIIAEDTDLEADRTDLEYSYVRPPQSDDWDDDPDVEYNTGMVTFTATNEDVNDGNSKMVFTIDDHGENGDIKLDVYFEVENVNDAPELTLQSSTNQWRQFQRISLNPRGSDIDDGDQLTYSVNFEEALGDGDVLPITEQLPYMSVTQGIDWDINPATGDFWFQLDDQDIWKTSSGWDHNLEITFVFQVEDKAGATATVNKPLILIDENEEPEKPDEIKVGTDNPVAGKPVNFYVDPVSDPDGDKVTYKWLFGDGSSGEGINVNHTYPTDGYRTVQMWVEDDQYDTEKISIRIEIKEASEGDDDTGDDDTGDDDDTGSGTSSKGDEGDDNTMIIIIIAVIVVVIIVVVVLIFVLLRKKPAQPAQQMYQGYDQAALGAYGAQGLPPGQEGELPPGQAPGLPPGQEGYQQTESLPPAGGEQPEYQGEAPQQQPVAPEAAPEAPQAQTEAPQAQPETTQEQQAPEAGNSCPSCGQPVDPTWFLCPNCKAPLQ